MLVYRSGSRRRPVLVYQSQPRSAAAASSVQPPRPTVIQSWRRPWIAPRITTTHVPKLNAALQGSRAPAQVVRALRRPDSSSDRYPHTTAAQYSAADQSLPAAPAGRLGLFPSGPMETDRRENPARPTAVAGHARAGSAHPLAGRSPGDPTADFSDTAGRCHTDDAAEGLGRSNADHASGLCRGPVTATKSNPGIFQIPRPRGIILPPTRRAPALPAGYYIHVISGTVGRPKQIIPARPQIILLPGALSPRGRSRFAAREPGRSWLSPPGQS